MSTPVPAEGGDGVDVSTAQPGNPTGHEVPNGNASIVAPNSQQRAPPVERTGERFTPRV